LNAVETAALTVACHLTAKRVAESQTDQWLVGNPPEASDPFGQTNTCRGAIDWRRLGQLQELSLVFVATCGAIKKVSKSAYLFAYLVYSRESLDTHQRVLCVRRGIALTCA
jgi:hypothetical protein